jgi:hypothetical protein
LWIALTCVVVVYKIKNKIEDLAGCIWIYSQVIRLGSENNGRELPTRSNIHSCNRPTSARSQNPGDLMVSQNTERVLKDEKLADKKKIVEQKEQIDALWEQQEQMAAKDAQIATVMLEQRKQIAAKDAQIAAALLEQREQIAAKDAQIDAALLEQREQMHIQIAAVLLEQKEHIPMQIAAALLEQREQMAAKDAQMAAQMPTKVAHMITLNSMMQVSQGDST